MVRREDYIAFDPPMGHDMAMPPELVRRGRRAIYVPEARATEPMVPDIEGDNKGAAGRGGYRRAVVPRGAANSSRCTRRPAALAPAVSKVCPPMALSVRNPIRV